MNHKPTLNRLEQTPEPERHQLTRHTLDHSNFEIVNFPFLDGDVLHTPSYGVYFSQLRLFAIVGSNVSDFNIKNQNLKVELLNKKVIDIINCLK